MPIAGVIISCDPARAGDLAVELAGRSGVEIHGISASNELVAVLESVSSEAMEQLMRDLGRIEGILHVGVSYLNTEDEAALPPGEGGQVPDRAASRREVGDK
ncbi:MAG: hypothetical protein BWK76_14020 [Desulfobulbaceae bacterium A2]|nr:MAG: hypothetical protein BWK76_14020 [Desulfobulbaceae bacterium A2]